MKILNEMKNIVALKKCSINVIDESVEDTAVILSSNTKLEEENCNTVQTADVVVNVLDKIKCIVTLKKMSISINSISVVLADYFAAVLPHNTTLEEIHITLQECYYLGHDYHHLSTTSIMLHFAMVTFTPEHSNQSHVMHLTFSHSYMDRHQV